MEVDLWYGALGAVGTGLSALTLYELNEIPSESSQYGRWEGRSGDLLVGTSSVTLALLALLFCQVYRTWSTANKSGLAPVWTSRACQGMFVLLVILSLVNAVMNLCLVDQFTSAGVHVDGHRVDGTLATALTCVASINIGAGVLACIAWIRSTYR